MRQFSPARGKNNKSAFVIISNQLISNLWFYGLSSYDLLWSDSSTDELMRPSPLDGSLSFSWTSFPFLNQNLKQPTAQKIRWGHKRTGMFMGKNFLFVAVSSRQLLLPGCRKIKQRLHSCVSKFNSEMFEHQHLWSCYFLTANMHQIFFIPVV